MAKARWNVAPARQDTAARAHHPGHPGRLGQGRRRQVVGHREPGRRLAATGCKVGVLDADIWGFSVPRMLGVDGRLGGRERRRRAR